MANFHAGDAATIFGITQNGFNTAWVDGQGAAGYTGLTLHVTAPGVRAPARLADSGDCGQGFRLIADSDSN